MTNNHFKMSDINTMKEDELKQFAVQLVRDAQENSEIIKKFQLQVSAQAGQLKEIESEKRSIAAVRDQHKMKLDVYMQIVDELLERILKARGYD